MLDPQPAIEILGVKLLEPVTTITDLVVSAICFYAFYKLARIKNRNKMHLYLKIYFFSMGVATAVGGLVGHGFLYVFSDTYMIGVSPWKLPGWLTSMMSVAMVERASIEYIRKLVKPALGRFFAWLNIIELLTFMTIAFTTLDFFFVEVHTAYGLLVVVASLNIYIYRKTKNPASKTFLIAVGFSAIGALVFMNEWGLSQWFNHFDISHCFLAISAYFFYKGAMKAIYDPLSS
ncbi:MAG: hypothetical protein K9J13_07795 [Saprospiraceae bacterium]|nr:hypothetical protein [Saprospiraceae bacterium]